MTALHATTLFNVQATINQWFSDKAATVTTPLSFSYTVNVLWPERELTPPCFSIVHAPINRLDEWQGRNAGGASGVRAANLADVSAWVTRTNKNWLAILAAMNAMIEACFASPASIVVKDYLTTPSAPSATAFLVRTTALTFTETSPDPNPDIMRSRAVLRYEWVLRTNVS